MKQSKLQRTPRGTPVRGSACVAWLVGELGKPLDPTARLPVAVKLAPRQVEDMIRRHARGERVGDLARHFAVSTWTVWRIVRPA